MQLLLKGFVFRLLFMAVSFLVSLLIAKLAGADRFGVLSLMIVNAAFIQIITGLGTDAAIVWHGISGKIADRNKVFSFTIYAALIQLILFVTAAYLFFNYSGKSILSSQSGIDFFYVELLYFSGLILAEKYASLFYSQQQATLCNKVLAIVSSGLLIILLVFRGSAPELIVANPAWIFAFFISVPASILVVYYHIKFNPALRRINRDDTRSFVNFSFIVLITNLIQFVAFRADFWFIDHFHGKGDVGIYAQASKFSQLLWIIPGVLAGLIIPALKNERGKMSSDQLVSVCRLLFFSHVFFAVLLAMGAFILYKYFLPVDYFKGFPSLLLMIPGYIVFTATTILAAFFSANRLLKINLTGSCLCCLLMLVLDLWLIPELSYNGAAIANLVSYTVTTAYFIAVSLKHTGRKVSDYYIIRKTDWNNIFNFNFKK